METGVCEFFAKCCQGLAPAFIAAAFVAAAATVTTTAISAIAAATAAFVAAAATAISAVAAATAAAFVTTTTATAAAISAGAWGFRFGCVYAKGTALKVISVEGFNSRIELALITEGNKREAFRAARFTVGDDFDPVNGAKLCEEVCDVFFGSRVGQVAHIDVHFLVLLIAPLQKILPETMAWGPDEACRPTWMQNRQMKINLIPQFLARRKLVTEL